MVEKLKMASRIHRISFYLMGMVVAIIGAVMVSANVFAVDAPKCDGKSSDSFKICVGGSYRTYDPMDPMGPDYTSSVIDSTETVKADGKGGYTVVGRFGQPNVSLEVKGKELWVYVGKGCVTDEKAVVAKVPFKDNIKDFKNDIQAAIGGKEYTFICDGPNMDTTYTVKFSSSDIYDESETEIPTVPEGTTEEEAGKVQTNCINSGAASTLGWIVCPFMDVMSDAAQNLYNGVVKDSLQVEPELFSGAGGGTRQGWETFRNIANVLFIVLFLFVIFSQITGVGINNYGIKKILPKLIISVILINLSYWVCIVFVDLSNILGNSLQALFNNLAAGLTPSSKVIPTDAFTGAGATVVSVIIAGLVFLAIGGAVTLNPAILLTMFIGLLGVVISILFLFLLLAVREAAIVVLVVIAPLAVICYMLPNTKSMFDKWLKFFEGLLLVYPICGLLIGGGNYVSQLLLASGIGDGDIFSAITAMIIGIVPIFLIPTVLRGSFSAMGNIGAKISGIGQRVSGATTGAARNSQAYKNAQERGLERQTRIKAGVDKDGNAKNLRTFGRIIRGGQRNVARNRARYLKDQDDRYREQSLMGVGYDAARVAQEKRAGSDAVANWELLVDNATQNGSNYDSLIGLYKDYMMNGNVDGAKAVARVAGRRKDLAAKFMKDAFTGENAMFTTDANGVRHDYNKGDVASVAKELTTGASSGTYRSASPLGYSFASQINENPASANYSYKGENGWQNRENVDNALKAFVTDRSEFAGIKGSEMDNMFELMGGYEDANGAHIDSSRAVMSGDEVARMQSLATDVIENRDKDPIDLTKAEQLAKISGKYRYDRNAGTFVPVNNAGGGVQARGGNTNRNSGIARENESFSARGDGSDNNV